MKNFESKYTWVDTMQGDFPAATIELEPMFYRASYSFANSHAGSLTREFLRLLWKNARQLGVDESTPLVIDSRTHMLMRGMYPCVPGWHHDDIPRDTPDGQPNYDKPSYFSRHLMAVVDADDARTGSFPQFLSGNVDVPWPVPEGEIVYNAWDAHLRAAGRQGVAVENRQVVSFSCSTFHRGMPAKSTGWRWFIRASWSTRVVPENKIRRNANVYLPLTAPGW
jgi:hypothetical protein